MKQPICNRVFLAGLIFLLGLSVRLHANVYATDIRVNGSFGPTILLPSNSVTISYILNDNATGGVLIQIESGTNVVKTFSSTNETAPTNAGLNSVTWDGSMDAATNAPEGAYEVSVTAASAGYCTWTNISNDSANFFVQVPRGIAVNQDSNSPYYGRVYVADASYYPGSSQIVPGIIKANADGSPADEGGFGTGGVAWSGQGYSPWKLCVGPDDRVYVDDFTDAGVVYSFDPILDDTNVLDVIRTDNYPAGDSMVLLSGLTVVGSGSGMEVLMTDEYPYGSAGVIGWNLTNGVAAPYDGGTVILPVDSDYLTQAPYDLSLDTNGFIYTIQQLTNGGPPSYGLMSFPPYVGEPESQADWAVAMYPMLQYSYGVSVDPTAHMIALAVLGWTHDPTTGVGGGLYLFNATNGDYMKDVDQTRGHGYFGTAWDKVGNLYALDGTAEAWRIYSPPGTNQATTIGVPVIQVYDSILSPQLCTPATDPNNLHFMLAGQRYVTYTIQKSCDLINWTNVAINFSTNANRCISVRLCHAHDFYRAVASP